MKGNVAPELRSQLQRAIFLGIKAAKQRALSEKRLQRALRKTPELQNCTSTACRCTLMRIVLYRSSDFFTSTTVLRASLLERVMAV